MGVAALLTIFVVGLAVGLLSGLIGIGGGVLIVPFLYFLYGHPQWFGVRIAPDLTTVVAHATSLFVIVPTSLRGVVAFQRAGLVAWKVVWPVGLASVVAAALGARVAMFTSPGLLKSAFGLLLVVSGIRLLRARTPTAADEGAPQRLRMAAPITVGIGGAVGFLSALLGVGGGIISIPLLIHVVGLELRRVAATSIGIIVITATAGTLSYMIGGRGIEGLPRGSIGYVHVAAGLVMFAGSVLSVRWGAALNQRLAPRALARLFALFFLVLGVRLIVLNAPALLSGA